MDSLRRQPLKLLVEAVVQTSGYPQRVLLFSQPCFAIQLRRSNRLR